MAFLDGKYWIVTGLELLGVTTDEGRVKELLQNAFLEDSSFPESVRQELGLRLKFEQYRLTRNGLDVPGYYADNAPEL